MAGTFMSIAGGAAAWALSIFSSQSPLQSGSFSLTGNVTADLGPRLSANAVIYLPGSEGYGIATDRWIPWNNPSLDVVVEVATEGDVEQAIQYANANDVPFLAVSGGHGGTVSLGKVKHGVGIWMRKMNDIKIASNGKSAAIGGGIRSKEFAHTLAKHGKQSVTGVCECTGGVAPMLGGGHGLLQGRHGLMADNLISARLVLADGKAVTVSEKENVDLLWGLKGAGQNFGIVTRFEYKIHDRTPENENWAYHVMIFQGEQLEDVYGVLDSQLGSEVELQHFSFFAFVPPIDPNKPSIILYLLYQAKTIPDHYIKPLADLNPLSHTNNITDLIGLPPALDQSLSGPACQHGSVYLRFPTDLDNYSIPGLRKAFDIFSSLPQPFRDAGSAIITEAYSVQGVQAIPDERTAYPSRSKKLLLSPFIVSKPEDKLDAVAAEYGTMMRDALVNASEKPLHAYMNYAYGDESQQALYGYDAWRLRRLRELKAKYDPYGRFDYYNPIR